MHKELINMVGLLKELQSMFSEAKKTTISSEQLLKMENLESINLGDNSKFEINMTQNVIVFRGEKITSECINITEKLLSIMPHGNFPINKAAEIYKLTFVKRLIDEEYGGHIPPGHQQTIADKLGISIRQLRYINEKINKSKLIEYDKTD